MLTSARHWLGLPSWFRQVLRLDHYFGRNLQYAKLSPIPRWRNDVIPPQTFYNPRLGSGESMAWVREPAV